MRSIYSEPEAADDLRKSTMPIPPSAKAVSTAADRTEYLLEPADEAAGSGRTSDALSGSEQTPNALTLKCSREREELRGIELLAALMLCSSAVILTDATLATGPARSQADLGLDAKEFGDVLSLQLYVQAGLTVPISGEVVDVFHRPRLYALILALLAVIGWPLVCTTAESYLYTRSALQGVLSSIGNVAAASLIGSHFAQASMATAMTTLYSAMNVANSLVTLIEGRMGADWRKFALVAAGACVLAAFAILLTATETPRQTRAKRVVDVLPSLWRAYRLFGHAFIRSPSLPILTVAQLLAGCYSQGFVQQRLVFEEAIDSQTATDTSGFLGVFTSLPVFFAAGLLADTLADRCGISRFYTASGLAAINYGALLLSLAVDAHEAPALFWPLQTLGFTMYNFAGGAVTTGLLQLLPVEIHGSAVALSGGCISIATALTNKFAGEALERMQRDHADISDPYTRIFIVEGSLLLCTAPLYALLGWREATDRRKLAGLLADVPASAAPFGAGRGDPETACSEAAALTKGDPSNPTPWYGGVPLDAERAASLVHYCFDRRLDFDRSDNEPYTNQGQGQAASCQG